VDVVKALLAVLATAATVLALSSCTSPASDEHTDHQPGSESSAAAQPAGFNDEDVMFATNMIPHHQQAVDMSALVPDRSTDPAVIKLAADVSAAQGPEIETMKVFLVQWKDGSDAGGQQRTDSGNDPAHDGMGGMEMHGMVDAATMAQLESLKGAQFDKLWLQSMIGHHEGAIEMANAEIAGGVNVDAKSLAKQIVATQEAEINQMKQMSGG
jgi:uncharacterized protein (DUF305 family)